MRIISQNGMIDVPYEISALSVGHKGGMSEFNIYARSKLLDEKPCIIATYSTEQKAKKAVEMLLEEYESHYFTRGGELCTVNHYVEAFGFIPPKVFKFPKDDELED